MLVLEVSCGAVLSPTQRLYLGQLTPEATLAAADDPDATTKSHQVCEANFYSGELALQRGARRDAIRLLQQSAASCPKGFVEYAGAIAELKALGERQDSRVESSDTLGGYPCTLVSNAHSLLRGSPLPVPP